MIYRCDNPKCKKEWASGEEFPFEDLVKRQRAKIGYVLDRMKPEDDDLGLCTVCNKGHVIRKIVEE